MHMNILILGGTGAMGLSLVQLLEKEERFTDVYITSRDVHVDRGCIHFIQGNAHEIMFLKELLERTYDVIVDFMSYTTAEFAERLNLFLEKTDQYVFLSSSRVYADNFDSPIIETSARLLDVSDDRQYLRTDEYALAKAKQEDLLINSSANNWTIIRPYITYNSNRFQLGVYEKEQWLYRALAGKPVIFPKELTENYTTLTYGKDVAWVINKLIGEQRALGEIFNVTCNNGMQWKSILAIYIKCLKDYTGKTEIPIIYTDTPIIIAGQRYQYVYDRLYNRIFNNSKTINIVGKFYEFMEPEIGLENCLYHFLDRGGVFREIDWKYEGILDKAAGYSEAIPRIDGYRNKVKYVAYRYIV